MTSDLKEAIRKRALQWDAFHEWKSNRTDAIALQERIAWYNEAFRFVKGLPSTQQARDIDEKVVHVKNLRARLKYLKCRRDV